MIYILFGLITATCIILSFLAGVWRGYTVGYALGSKQMFDETLTLLKKYGVMK